MRVVFDTNVLVSALLVPGSKPAQIVRLVIAGEVNLMISQDIIEEARRVFLYPKLVKMMKRNKVSPDDLDVVIEKICSIAVMTPGQLTVEVIKNDPTDNAVLACAVEGEADYIISGDHHLTDLHEFQGIFIISPATILALVKNELFPE